MDNVEFAKIKQQFASVDVDEKIRIYTNTRGLTENQFRELLLLFPLNELGKLEAAMG